MAPFRETTEVPRAPGKQVPPLPSPRVLELAARPSPSCKPACACTGGCLAASISPQARWRRASGAPHPKSLAPGVALLGPSSLSPKLKGEPTSSALVLEGTSGHIGRGGGSGREGKGHPSRGQRRQQQLGASSRPPPTWKPQPARPAPTCDLGPRAFF